VPTITARREKGHAEVLVGNVNIASDGRVIVVVANLLKAPDQVAQPLNLTKLSRDHLNIANGVGAESPLAGTRPHANRILVGLDRIAQVVYSRLPTRVEVVGLRCSSSRPTRV